MLTLCANKFSLHVLLTKQLSKMRKALLQVFGLSLLDLTT